MHADIIVIQDIKITKAVVFTFTDVKMGSKKLRRSPLWRTTLMSSSSQM